MRAAGNAVSFGTDGSVHCPRKTNRTSNPQESVTNQYNSRLPLRRFRKRSLVVLK